VVNEPAKYVGIGFEREVATSRADSRSSLETDESCVGADVDPRNAGLQKLSQQELKCLPVIMATEVGPPLKPILQIGPRQLTGAKLDRSLRTRRPRGIQIWIARVRSSTDVPVQAMQPRINTTDVGWHFANTGCQQAHRASAFSTLRASSHLNSVGAARLC
jgi:hypothetical protein